MKKTLTTREVIAILRENGFELDRQKGSHRTFKGIVKGSTRIVLVSGHNLGADIPKGTLKSIIRQSGLPAEAFTRQYTQVH